MRIVSIGEILWDVFRAQEILGGAPLNFSINAHRLGHSAVMASAVGCDDHGHRAIELIRSLGLTTELIQTTTKRPTGTAIVDTDADGNAKFIIERPAAFDFLDINAQLSERIHTLQPEWVYFGTLAQTTPEAEERLHRVIQDSSEARCFYDINLRKGHWSIDLVERLSRIATVLKLNNAEARLLFALKQTGHEFRLQEFCRYWSSTFGTQTICVTLGDEGCAIFDAGALHVFPGYQVKVVDTVGAGDAFAAGFLHGLDLGWPTERIAAFANSLGAAVASRPGATPPWTLTDLETIRSIPLLGNHGKNNLPATKLSH